MMPNSHRLIGLFVFLALSSFVCFANDLVGTWSMNIWTSRDGSYTTKRLLTLYPDSTFRFDQGGYGDCDSTGRCWDAIGFGINGTWRGTHDSLLLTKTGGDNISVRMTFPLSEYACAYNFLCQDSLVLSAISYSLSGRYARIETSIVPRVTSPAVTSINRTPRYSGAVDLLGRRMRQPATAALFKIVRKKPVIAFDESRR
jgi:hypothetical protein